MRADPLAGPGVAAAGNARDGALPKVGAPFRRKVQGDELPFQRALCLFEGPGNTGIAIDGIHVKPAMVGYGQEVGSSEAFVFRLRVPSITLAILPAGTVAGKGVEKPSVFCGCFFLRR